MPNEKLVRFNLMISPTQLKEIDHYRGENDNPPPRGAAVRELISLGLEAHKKKVEQSRDE